MEQMLLRTSCAAMAMEQHPFMVTGLSKSVSRYTIVQRCRTGNSTKFCLTIQALAMQAATVVTWLAAQALHTRLQLASPIAQIGIKSVLARF